MSNTTAVTGCARTTVDPLRVMEVLGVVDEMSHSGMTGAAPVRAPTSTSL